LDDLKPALVGRYEKWLRKHPDGVEPEHTPNARTQKITHEDTVARAQAQRDQFQAEERARHEAREQQRMAHTGVYFYLARNGRKRPASIPELAEMAMLDLWDDTKDFKQCLRMADNYRKEGKDCVRKGDLEDAFVALVRAATLMLEKLPMHRDYNSMLDANQQQNLSLVGISPIISLFTHPFSSKISLSVRVA
jgi:hypothetical protein